MGNRLIITGNVSGRLLAGAMMRAQAATPGDLEKKQPAGVGIFKQYLDLNTVRGTAWSKASKLLPDQVIARASLDSNWLEKAGRLITDTTDLKIRRTLLGQIITPQLENNLFMTGITAAAEKTLRLKAEKLSRLFKPVLPEIELEMVPIPAGEFKMGSLEYDNEKFADGVPHIVQLSTFLIGKYEVTNAQYEVYVQQTGQKEPWYWKDANFGREKPNHPVVGVNWEKATLFAGWLGMRLPTESEGEFAARGPDGRQFPWGNKWDPSRVNFDTEGTCPVDAHPRGVSPFGVMDLSGNVSEWRFDWYDEKYDPTKLINPQGPKQGILKVLRGGSWCHSESRQLRSSFRHNATLMFAITHIGLRVASDI